MIGKLLIPAGQDKTVEAILNDDGQWECEDETIQLFLTTSFPLADWYAGPSAGQRGVLLLHDAGEFLKAKVEIEPGEPPVEGRVY